MTADPALRLRVEALLSAGATDAAIVTAVGCSPAYVTWIRRDYEAAARAVVARMPAPVVERHTEGSGRLGPPAAATLLEGGYLLAEMASEGRAVLTLREAGHGTCCARATRPQLDILIVRLRAMRDALPADPPEIEKIRDVGSKRNRPGRRGARSEENADAES